MPARSAIRVDCPPHSVRLPLQRIGAGAPRLLVVAGVHGWEHSGIRVAYALAERLAGIKALRGTVQILPVANPAGFAAERRDNPVDGKNLGECFGERSGSPSGIGQTEAIARRILALLEGCSHVLDLHSAGEARYLPHALFLREQDAESAAAAGLPFALLRRRTREGRASGMLAQAAARRGVSALALEMGGGITTYSEDIDRSLDAVLSLLAFWGYLPPEYRVQATRRVLLRDERTMVLAREDGAFYPTCATGASVGRKERIGTWVSLNGFAAIPVIAPKAGLCVYLRIRCRSRCGDTLAMLLPDDPVRA